MIPKTQISSFFTIPNPKYHQIIKMGKTPLFVPRTIHLGSQKADPPGVAYWHAKQIGIIPTLSCIFPCKTEIPFIKLRPQQEEAFNIMCKIRGGLIVMPTGSGKSMLFACYFYARKEPMLILVHSKDMVKQIADLFSKFFSSMTIGMWNSSYKIPSEGLMITTFSSFRKEKERFQNYKILIVDEADIAMTKSLRDGISEHPATYKFGFTATKKTDFDEWLKEPCALERFWGYKIEPEYPQNEILKEIIVKTYRANYTDEYDINVSPRTDWILFRQKMQEDQERKETIKSFISKYHEENDRTLVLFDRIEDVETAYQTSPFEKKYIIYGQIKKKDREAAKVAFLSEGGIMYAQYQTSSRGIDYPECNKLFLFIPMKKETTIRQAMGRVLRFLPDKQAIIYDLCESSIGSQFRAREKIYKTFFPNVKITYEN